MTRYQLKHTEDKDKVLREWELLRDCINTRAEERHTNGDMYFNSYSLLMFFKNRKPLRVRETNSRTIKPARTDKWLRLWAETGIGTLNIKTSPRESLKELWPARRTIGGEPCFTYFDGYFGNCTLWTDIRGARRENLSIVDTITNWFDCHTFQQILDDIVITSGYGQQDTQQRNFKFTTWKGGELYSKIERHDGEEVLEGPPGWKMHQV